MMSNYNEHGYLLHRNTQIVLDSLLRQPKAFMELMKETAIPPKTLTYILKRLEKHELVWRQEITPEVYNSKRTRYSITMHGAKVMTHLNQLRKIM
jgi:DNA-binding HxlR family transcriptional regulator